MAVEILLPRLGWDMTEGTFGEWLKQDGDTIQPGDLLYTVEGDKAIQEVESMDAGILHIRPDGPQTGDVISVGTLLAYIAQSDEAVTFQAEPAIAKSAERVAVDELQTTDGKKHPRPEHVIRNRQQATRSGKSSSPRARRVATELNIDWTQLNGSGRTGRIIERDVRAAAALQTEATPSIQATPVAARMAAEAGIDLAQLAAEKPGQRIQRQDVEAAIAAQKIAEPPSSVEFQGERIPSSRVRQLIAQRMSHSSQTTAAVTLTTEADATELVALRQQLKSTLAPRNLVVPSYNDLLIKLTAVALEEHQMLNAIWAEDEILIPDAVHIGLAVDTDEGLLVPVVRDVQAKGVRQIAAETESLIEQARTGKISSSNLQGGTFTITNLGAYNIDAFTPIINLPQCAILGVGRIVEKPAVYNGEVVPRQTMTLSLTFDHRVIDGAPAARGLDKLREFVETPLSWLV
ncbi:2-oxo acid dehydrogenase subunit E2 [Chloroflexi bacterium TSY]|nr:2-oxo acid dehydrogenase subunit E2 [Chloroflexi bacterium TSY]